MLCITKKKHTRLIARFAGLAITNQRETTILWDRSNGRPLYNSIVWQDRRTLARCAYYIKEGHEPSIQQKTGLVLDPYFSASKIQWILENVVLSDLKQVAVGTMDSYLLWQLTLGKIHATDASNASRTLLYDIQKCNWDESLCALFSIPKQLLPQVFPSSYDYGEVTNNDFLQELGLYSIRD